MYPRVAKLKEIAKAKGSKIYNTGKRCKQGHLADRLVKTSACVICARESGRKYDNVNRRKKWLRSKYRISLQEYNDMLVKQDNRCKICSKLKMKKKNFSVDHCHITGKIRGILCQKCNTLLGMAKDSIKILEKSIEYLKK